MSASSTELFRRGVVLPKNSKALLDLRSDTIEDIELYRVATFANDAQFYRIWKTGVFLQINSKCNVMIDDFEEEEVRNTLGAIPPVITEAIQDKSLQVEDRQLLEEIKSLAIEAQQRGAALFLIF